MPLRNDIQSVLLIGSGPIIIGQACEFDYSGTQACQALREEGLRVILLNANPATIMTDPEFADATYIEPITPDTVKRIIEKERPDAVLPTMGGQTALNAAMAVARDGWFERNGVKLIGADSEAIDKAENRQRFRETMDSIGLAMPHSQIVHSLAEAKVAAAAIGYPVVIRPSFTLGGTGGGIAYDEAQLLSIASIGLRASPTNELLIEESVIGWKEFEMEVVRDRNDNCIIVCSIENVDPMGVHTGDSITIAPALTLTDKEYQQMRDASFAVLRAIGVETGGSNVQFAINPDDGRMLVIEMNPRVSRSSALASKATGFPIARVAAKLALGYTLDELANAITGGRTPASFEPTIDYIVTKIPRFAFEKFPQSDPTLGTQMKSVGEAMAVGATFQESLQKALRSLETGIDGFTPRLPANTDRATIEKRIATPTAERLLYVADAFRAGFTVDEVYVLTGIDRWFLGEIAELIKHERALDGKSLAEIDAASMRTLKQQGFADARLAQLLHTDEAQLRTYRLQQGVTPVYKRVDTCAGEFVTETAYMYASFAGDVCESLPTARRKIMILGGGPNRIGQGIEFDYCCVHASMALREAGFETIMVNCNPETVSTDFDMCDRLYFEPLTLEDVLAIIAIEQPEGVIVQYGGQTPLKLAAGLAAAGVTIIGTSVDSIDIAEDRGRFQALLKQLFIQQPRNETAVTVDDALTRANAIGYPIVVRPSYVLGGRAMEIVHNDEQLRQYMREATLVSPSAPVLLDDFVEDAVEIDVDLVRDVHGQILIGGVMRHIEQAGVHSGDSACALPAYGLLDGVEARIREQAAAMANALDVVGLMNVQFAVNGETIYVLEVNPRASRTVPFVAKATGVPLAKIGALCMAGRSLAETGVTEAPIPPHVSIKEAVFPFMRFRGVDPLLRPEMRATGEVMGIAADIPHAFYKAYVATGETVPTVGQGEFGVLLLVDDARTVTPLLATLRQLSAVVYTSPRVAAVVPDAIPLADWPTAVSLVNDDKIQFAVMTTDGRIDPGTAPLREAILSKRIAYATTIAWATLFIEALSLADNGGDMVTPLQHWMSGVIRS